MLYWRVSDRSQSKNEQYSNTVKDDFFTHTMSQNIETAYHKARW